MAAFLKFVFYFLWNGSYKYEDKKKMSAKKAGKIARNTNEALRYEERTKVHNSDMNLKWDFLANPFWKINERSQLFTF